MIKIRATVEMALNVRHVRSKIEPLEFIRFNFFIFSPESSVREGPPTLIYNLPMTTVAEEYSDIVPRVGFLCLKDGFALLLACRTIEGWIS